MKFEFQNPTRLIFGAGTLSQLGEVVNTRFPPITTSRMELDWQ